MFLIRTVRVFGKLSNRTVYESPTLLYLCMDTHKLKKLCKFKTRDIFLDTFPGYQQGADTHKHIVCEI